MAVAPNLDVNVVKRFAPLDTLSVDKVKEVISKSAVQKIPAGRVLFKIGDKDKWTVYLLSGSVELKGEDGNKQVIEANTDASRTAIANKIPRPATAKAKTDISILIIDKDLLDILMNWNEPSSIEVSDLDDEDEDWMTRFLQSNAFLQLPASNIQALMMRLHETPLAKGSNIIKENDDNDDKFYIIQQGRCVVSKTSPTSGEEIPLAELRLGDGFGEEALITGGKRGASVSMKTDGVILSLEKKDFIDLLVAPLIHRVKSADLEKAIGDTQLIDIRNENEFAANGLEKAINIPISLIRNHLSKLSPDQHYIVYSNHENRSSAAAFLFIQQGFECSILEHGVGEPNLEAKPQEAPKPAQEEQFQPKKEPVTRDAKAAPQQPAAKPTPEKKAESAAEPPKVERRTSDRRKANITSPEVIEARKKAEAQAKQLLMAEKARKEAESMASNLRGEAQEALKKAEEEAKRHV